MLPLGSLVSKMARKWNIPQDRFYVDESYGSPRWRIYDMKAFPYTQSDPIAGAYRLVDAELIADLLNKNEYLVVD